MRNKLRKYISRHYHIRLLEQYDAVHQGSSSVVDYITRFENIRLRCGVREMSDITITRFKEGLRPEIQKEFIPYYITTLEQVYRIAQDMEIYLRRPISGQPSTPGPNTSRPDPTHEQCPSQLEQSLLLPDTIHQAESQEDQSLDGARADESYDPLVMKVRGDDEDNVDEIVDPLEASSDDELDSQEFDLEVQGDPESIHKDLSV
jgi:hypothetical protein